MSGEPFPKAKQLSRGARKYRRFAASAKQWQVLAQTKNGPCRVCLTSASNGRVYSKIQLHHVVSRAQGGDDYAANLVPVCPDCHRLLHNREPEACRALCASLTDSEYAYMIGKAGEGAAERLYGGITFDSGRPIGNSGNVPFHDDGLVADAFRRRGAS